MLKSLRNKVLDALLCRSIPPKPVQSLSEAYVKYFKKHNISDLEIEISDAGIKARFEYNGEKIERRYIYFTDCFRDLAHVGEIRAHYWDYPILNG